MRKITTSNLFYNNRDFYNDGRSYNGDFPEDTEMNNPFMRGSNQAVLINPAVDDLQYRSPIVAATTQIHPNRETDRFYPNRGNL